jgi:cytochrome b
MATPAPVPPAASPTPVRVWDLPTRLFHWTLAATVIGSVISAKIGGNAMVWHFRLGALVIALVAFRVLWGLVGGRWSRFASFIYAPSTVLRYLRGQARPGEHLDVGHNPLGSFSVFALLGFLALQAATGLVADDEIANVGPLNRFASAGLVARAQLAQGLRPVAADRAGAAARGGDRVLPREEAAQPGAADVVGRQAAACRHAGQRRRRCATAAGAGAVRRVCCGCGVDPEPGRLRQR